MEEHIVTATVAESTNIAELTVTLKTRLPLFKGYNRYQQVCTNTVTISGPQKRVHKKVDKLIQKARQRYAKILTARETSPSIPSAYDLRTS